jgi:REP element-mobilizing transposase RayT
MGNTLAIHWAATTHGTWLHGDPRGSWRNGRLIGRDPYLELEVRARMSHDAVVLDTVERALIAEAFGIVVKEQCFRVFAATVQATHVHLVLGPLHEDLDTVIARFKRRSAATVLKRRRELCRVRDPANPAKMAGLSPKPAKMAGLYSRAILARQQTVPRSLWTAGKFPVFIFNEDHLMNAIEYVRDHNRRKGLPADPFEWIDPLYPPGEMVGERCHRSSLCEEPRW